MTAKKQPEKNVKIDVICAGLGRTGTMSLKMALEKLGFGPCYHMFDIFNNPDHVALWRDVLEGKPNWKAILSGYRSVADEPPALYWRELLEMNPEAKVILSIRPAEDWYESVKRTVYEMVMKADAVPDKDVRSVLDLAREVVFERLLEGAFENRDRAIEIFDAHNRSIIEGVKPAQLLVFELIEGWSPLCRFLNAAVPEIPFPHSNTTADFRAKAGLN